MYPKSQDNWHRLPTFARPAWAAWAAGCLGCLGRFGKCGQAMSVVLTFGVHAINWVSLVPSHRTMFEFGGQFKASYLGWHWLALNETFKKWYRQVLWKLCHWNWLQYPAFLGTRALQSSKIWPGNSNVDLCAWLAGNCPFLTNNCI